MARDGGMYVSEKGGEPRKLIGKPVGALPLLQPCNMAADGVVLPVDSFEKELLQTEEAVYRATDGETAKMASGGGFFLSRDGETLVYLKEGRLYRAATDDPLDAVRLADAVTQAVCSADGRTIFFLIGDALFAIDGDNAPTPVAEGVERLVVTAKGHAFFTIDGVLFSCTDGETHQQVRDVKGEVKALSCIDNAVLVYDTDGEVYASTGNTRFREIK